jgi:Golgi nucleoside diphosphatase
MQASETSVSLLMLLLLLLLQSSTPVSLKATAGLRLLPGDKSEKILDAVIALLKTYPFKMAKDAVSIMDGKQQCDHRSTCWHAVDAAAAATVTRKMGMSEREI